MAKKPTRTRSERSPWAAATVAPEDLEVAKREALLQLKIGRSSHVAAVALSAALALDAILILVRGPHGLPALHGGETGLPALLAVYYLVLPIAGSLAVAAVGVVAKWEAFQVWPWEPHFSVSVGALALSALVVVLFGLRLAGAGPVGHATLYPAFVPLALVGASLGLVGISATWRPWAARQWTSVLTALLPLAAVGVVFFFPAYGGSSSEGLAVGLLIAAILYQTSGSFLHLASSGTGPHEQAVVLSGQNRIVKLADELRQRDEAIRFREASLLKREASVESNEAVLERARADHDEREKRIGRLEEADQARLDALGSREREVAGREAALEANSRALIERGKELEVRNAELARQAPELAAREQRLARHEGELAKRDVEIRQRVGNLDRREAAVTDGENRVAARRKEVEQKTADLLRREGEIAAREHGGPGGAAGAGRPNAATADLATREARLKHLQGVLDEQNAQLGRRSKEAAEQARVLETTLHQIAERQSHLAARETSLSQREADLDERLKTADERRLQFETAVRDYQQRLDEVGRQQVSAAQKGADLDRRLAALAERERTLTTGETRLRTTSDSLDRREGELLLRERSLDADEAEVSLRRQEIAREGDLPFAGLLAVAAADRADSAGGGSPRSSRGRRGRPAHSSGVVDIGLPTDEATLTPTPARKYPDRQPTGTPRLDDLLLGGLPPKSHVVLVGEAFVGKEVALYAFVAEGLKRGEPALLVTAARSASEISTSLGVVVPQFREYEQMGSVTWIDASGAGGEPGPHRLLAQSSDDRAGLLTSLVQGAKLAEEASKGGPFRVGFFGLSAVLAHSDERASFSFLQNVVGILKPRNALAMYALEAGALSEAQVESLLGLLDGAILFRQDRDRTFLSVKGFGDVATRDWVEVRATNRTLVIGSFALERIR
ncbi:MAG TPA: ATPase domain-containing protein [Thermoplasmata archaeon]|nr:ATPase domain-containing protein [Thermoplasmata archaeon]